MLHVVWITFCCVSWVLLFEFCELLSVALNYETILSGCCDNVVLDWLKRNKPENRNTYALGLDWTVGYHKQHDQPDEYGYHDKSGYCDTSVINKISGMVWTFWIILSLSWFFLLLFVPLEHPVKQKNSLHSFSFLFPDCLVPYNLQAWWLSRLPGPDCHTFLRNSPTLFSGRAEELWAEEHTFLLLTAGGQEGLVMRRGSESGGADMLAS